MLKKKIEITINGKVYPCRMTMGALLRFKRETGQEMNDVKDWGVSELCTLLWCCIASASKHDGMSFDLSLIDFADSIQPDQVTAWAEAAMLTSTAEAGNEEEQKKTQ